MTEEIDYKQVIVDKIKEDEYWALKPDDGFSIAAVIEGDNRRWTRADQYILSAPNGRYYSYVVDEPPTEMQAREIYADSVSEITEVYPSQRQVTVTDWKKVEGS